MSDVALTYLLTPGTAENISHVQQNFENLRDFLASTLTGIGSYTTNF